MKWLEQEGGKACAVICLTSRLFIIENNVTSSLPPWFKESVTSSRLLIIWMSYHLKLSAVCLQSKSVLFENSHELIFCYRWTCAIHFYCLQFSHSYTKKSILKITKQVDIYMIRIISKDTLFTFMEIKVLFARICPDISGALCIMLQLVPHTHVPRWATEVVA